LPSIPAPDGEKNKPKEGTRNFQIEKVGTLAINLYNIKKYNNQIGESGDKKWRHRKFGKEGTKTAKNTNQVLAVCTAYKVHNLLIPLAQE
jgi:hypothetical protein